MSTICAARMRIPRRTEVGNSMTWNPLHLRRPLVRLALLFAVMQLIALAGVVFALPAMRSLSLGPALIIALIVVDLVGLSVIAGGILHGSVSVPLSRLLQDVRRIAEGDLHHRVGETCRPELPNHGPRRLVGEHGAGVRGGPRELTLRQTAASIRAASIHLALDAYRALYIVRDDPSRVIVLDAAEGWPRRGVTTLFRGSTSDQRRTPAKME